jgi:hypothetical protein
MGCPDRNTPNRVVGSRVLGLMLAVALSSPTWAASEESAGTVDLELVIAVDVSSSMSQEEQRVQREGYINALRSPDVFRVIKSGRRGRIAIAYFEWARLDYQRVLLPWTIIDGLADAASIADAIDGQPAIPQGGTSISVGLQFAGRLLQTSGLVSDRRGFIDGELAAHAQYLIAVDRMFAAIDANDSVLATKIDRSEVDPTFDKIGPRVLEQARLSQGDESRSLAQLASIQKVAGEDL